MPLEIYIPERTVDTLTNAIILGPESKNGYLEVLNFVDQLAESDRLGCLQLVIPYIHPLRQEWWKEVKAVESLAAIFKAAAKRTEQKTVVK